MAVAASIGAAVASTAGSVISARSQKKAADKQRKQQLKGVAALRDIRETAVEDILAGEYLDRYGAEHIFGRRADEVDLGQSIRDAIQANTQNLPLNQRFVAEQNQAITQEALRSAQAFDPNFRANLSSLSDQARSLLRGEIPEDVVGEIMRNRAGQNAAFGVPGSQRQATSRDLGLTSLDLQGRGAGIFAQIQGIRNAVDPIGRQLSLAQQNLTPSQQIEQDLANNVLRSGADPAAQQLFNLSFQGAREEARGKAAAPVPVNNTLGAGLSAAGGALSGLVQSGLFSGGSTRSNFNPQGQPVYTPGVPIVQPRLA